MPIRPLPQFEADLAEDRKLYEKLKPPTTMVVRFGIMRLIGEFPYSGDAKPGCGSKVVVRTHRGIELAEMLTTTCPNSGCGKSVSRHEMLEYIENSGGRDYPFFNQGKVLRIATMDDLNQQAKIDAERPKMVMRVREIMGEMMGMGTPSLREGCMDTPGPRAGSPPPDTSDSLSPPSPESHVRLAGPSGGNTGGSAPGWLAGPEGSPEPLHDQSHQENVGHHFAAEHDSQGQGGQRVGERGAEPSEYGSDANLVRMQPHSESDGTQGPGDTPLSERGATQSDTPHSESGGTQAQAAPPRASSGSHFPQNMKVVDAEPILGNERLTFYFASEDRVDFRDLVARLAAEYRIRIEMRQVGARDEARLVADYERCGQQCCCKQFLKVLKPVSMRSAKIQKATLDPLKISGRCGRLMCCLRYEDESYDDLRKRLPKKKVRLKTPEGWGIVMDTQILTQLVLIRLESLDKEIALTVEELGLVDGIQVNPPADEIKPSPDTPSAAQGLASAPAASTGIAETRGPSNKTGSIQQPPPQQQRRPQQPPRSNTGPSQQASGSPPQPSQQPRRPDQREGQNRPPSPGTRRPDAGPGTPPQGRERPPRSNRPDQQSGPSVPPQTTSPGTPPSAPHDQSRDSDLPARDESQGSPARDDPKRRRRRRRRGPGGGGNPGPGGPSEPNPG